MSLYWKKCEKINQRIVINIPSDFTSKKNELSAKPQPGNVKFSVSVENLLPDKVDEAKASYLSFLTPEETFFGLTKYCHPRMKKFIIRYSKKVAHVDANATLTHLQKVGELFKEIKDKNQTVLFVTTKLAFRSTVNQMLSQTSHLFVTYRWPGGLLTNMEELIKRIQVLKNMQQKVEDDEISHFTKREKMLFIKKKYRLEKTWQGLTSMTKLPDYLFVIDPVAEKIAVTEAIKMGIPVIALTKSTFNPELLHYFIPGNDNSINTTEVVLKFVLTSWKLGEVPIIELPIKNQNPST